MHHITLKPAPPRATIEIDGTLDLVAAYDLRQVIEVALEQACRRVSFDLSRVVRVDTSALSALLDTLRFAESQGAEINVVALSGPASRVTELADRAACCDCASA